MSRPTPLPCPYWKVDDLTLSIGYIIREMKKKESSFRLLESQLGNRFLSLVQNKEFLAQFFFNSCYENIFPCPAVLLNISLVFFLVFV